MRRPLRIPPNLDDAVNARLLLGGIVIYGVYSVERGNSLGGYPIGPIRDDTVVHLTVYGRIMGLMMATLSKGKYRHFVRISQMYSNYNIIHTFRTD